MSVPVKLLVGALLLVGTTTFLAYRGGANSWQYYLTADECAAQPSRFVGQRVRVSGKVAHDTLEIGEGRRSAKFVLAGESGKLPVACTGTLPDNLAEDMAVVVEGRLTSDGALEGEKVLTRCASKYEAER